MEDQELEPILNAQDYPTVIHGTYLGSWESIQKSGLKRMNRIHIHFAPGEPGDEGVISGMRRSAEVYIYINLSKALKGELGGRVIFIIYLPSYLILCMNQNQI